MKQTLVAPKVNEDYGDTVPARPPDAGLQVANEVKTSSTMDSMKLAGDGMMSCLHVNFCYLTYMFRETDNVYINYLATSAQRESNIVKIYWETNGSYSVG